MTKPNILYLHSHDTGRYIQPYGFAVPTPNLQKFAEQGTLFRNAFCANPTCSPSRACLLTGQYAHSNGMTGLAHRGFALNDYGHHMARHLQTQGYYAALSGMQHVAAGTGEPWKTIGYDEYLGPAGQAHLHAANWLAAKPKQPFFLAVGFGETHRRFPEASQLDNPNYVRPPLPLPDTPETRQDMANYITCARELDRKMGAVLDALATTGLAENTLVILTTDHGIAFPSMKCNLYDHGTGVMLMLRGPQCPEGRAVDSLASQVDLFPTVCDIAGVPHPDWLQGTSLLPLLTGEADSVRDEVFAEVNYHASYEPMRAVRTARWKYIRRYDDRARPVLPNSDDSPSKKLWMNAGWNERPRPAEQLHDLVFDPNEADNLADRPGHEDVLADMRQRLDRWMRDTGDPLLAGPVPAPAGAKVNDPDGISPQEKVRDVTV